MLEISKDEVEKILQYDPGTGILRWKCARKKEFVGAAAGAMHKEGYLRIRIKGTLYAAHRLAWLLHTGAMPTGVIDHINGIRDDNRISNLRDVTISENAQNQKKARSDNKSSGLLGVYFQKNRGNWQAQITLNGKAKHLGVYPTKEEAHEAYLKEKRQIHSACEI